MRDQRRDEAPARLVVAAQEQEDADRQRQRQDDPAGRDQHHRMALGRERQVRPPGPEARAGSPGRGGIEQREDAEPRDAQHDDLAERVEAAEIDEDDVDHIGPAAAALGIGEVEGRDARPGVAGQHRPGDPPDSKARGDRHKGIAPLARCG